MLYKSTRGRPGGTFRDILLTGLAPDSGLFVPESYPQLGLLPSEDMFWTYPALALHVMNLFAPDIPHADLSRMVASTYTPETFGGHTIAPLGWLSDDIALLKLSAGPTYSFKDMALQLVGRLMEYELAAREETLTVLAATSGDTGSAAAHALRGRKGIRLVILIPHERMSDFQRRQMTTIRDANVQVVAVRGTFDDCQRIVKEVNADTKFKEEHRIGAINSINWARIAAQTAYWVWAYVQARSIRPGLPITMAVPSGNFGNALSAYIARRMGAMHDILVCTNQNDVLVEFFRTGIYRPRASDAVRPTTSPSMDIAVASNLERLIFDLLNREPVGIREIDTYISNTGYYKLPSVPEWKELGFSAGMATEEDVLRSIRTTHEREGIIIDPHTAVAMHVVRTQGARDRAHVVAETAAPIKFAKTIRKAIGTAPPLSPEQEAMMEAPERFRIIDQDPAAVKRIIAEL